MNIPSLVGQEPSRAGQQAEEQRPEQVLQAPATLGSPTLIGQLVAARLHPGRRDGLRLARCFGHHQGMIRRFATNLAARFTCHQAERDVHPVKVQQRTSGGCWRTLAGLADFAVVRSSLSTAATWGMTTSTR